MRARGSRRRRFAIVLLSLLVLVYGVKVYRKAGDFRNFHYRGAEALSGGPVYVDEPYAITYPPFFLLVTAPYAALPFPAAKIAWYLTQAALFALLLGVTARLLADETGPLRNRRLFWFLLILALSRFLMSHFENEQFDFVVALSVLGALLLARRGKPGWAGVCVGAGAAVKLTPLLFLAYIIYKRNYRMAFFGTGAFVLFLLLPDLLLAPFREGSLLRDWYELVIVKVNPLSGGSPWASGGKIWAPGGILNQSLSVTLLRYLSETQVTIKGAAGGIEAASVHFAALPPGVVSKIAWAAEFALLVPVLLFGRRRWDRTPARSLLLETALITVLMLLISPHTSKPHLVILTAGYGLLLADGLGPRRDRTSLLLAALSFALATLTVDGIWGRHLGDLFQAYGAITLGILVLYAGLLRLLVGEGKGSPGRSLP